MIHEKQLRMYHAAVQPFFKKESEFTFVSSKYGVKAAFIPFCMKTVLSGISPKSSLTIIAHLLH
jgi:hypothetical protein